MIRHFLLIKFKKEATESAIAGLKKAFEDIPMKISGVQSVEWGVNDSPENLNKDYTHSVLMTFEDDKGRQAYLPHKEHEALKEAFIPLLDDIIVFDYQV